MEYKKNFIDHHGNSEMEGQLWASEVGVGMGRNNPYKCGTSELNGLTFGIRTADQTFSIPWMSVEWHV